ncbi:unnamed protein product [Lactuca virosa]|uniref:Uncharacterized protein n=1 Tax=Lactuca virosa TaxID=75947 RepID=A0AAU9MLT8_9ASTR|nr:unnamed protein product [Lactuca virosa]
MDSDLENPPSLKNLIEQLKSYTNASNALISSFNVLLEKSDMEERFSEPMVMIGIYIAVASLFCILPPLADLVHGLRTKKFWFPNKYFTMNIASFSALGVATKLPVDLSSPMPGVVDQFTKLGNMAFMCAMMANLLPALASMSNKALIANIIGLGVIVITMVVNVCIEIKTGNVKKYCKFIAIIYVVVLLMVLVIHACTSLAILKCKQILELKYQAAHESALNEQELQQGRSTVEKLKKQVKKYWIMAETSHPQFLTACSVTSCASGVLSVISTLLHAWLMLIAVEYWMDFKSAYKWSMLVILITQFIGSLVGTIAPLCRSFATLSYKLSVKWMWKKMKQHHQTNENFSNYVLQLEDDTEIAEGTLKRISNSYDHWIKKAEKRQPKNLMKLLVESEGFGEVEKYYKIHQVRRLVLDEHEPLICWSLSLVTLASIAISLTNIQQNLVDRLMHGLKEGMVYVKLVEESLNPTDDHATIQKAAKTLLVDVEVFESWLGNKLQRRAPQGNTVRHILEWLMDTSKNMVNEVEITDDISRYKFICSNAMSCVTETILLDYHADIDQINQERLFETISSLIAGILAACLSNLPDVIELKSNSNAIEKRYASVYEAAQLLGETTLIINTLEDRELTRLNVVA